MEGLFTVVKKKRSFTLRRPWPNPQSVLHNCYLSHHEEDETSPNTERNNKELKTLKSFNVGNSKQVANDNEGVLALFAPKNNDATPHTPAENKPIKVRLKLSGAMRASGPTEAYRSSDQQKLRSQDNSDYNCSSREKSNGVQRDLHGEVKITGEAVFKGKRLPRRGALDASFGDSDEDDEIRYLKKLGASKFATKYTLNYQNHKDAYGSKNWKIAKSSKVSNAYHLDDDYVLPSGWTTNSRKRSRAEKNFSDAEHFSESKRKRQKIKSADILTEGKLQPLTTRQRALQSGNDGGMSSLIEFPNGLPLAAAKNKSVKLSEEEKQAKKAEASQRRKMQAEKAARESEAKIIRKILGLDSEKKKAEKEKTQADKANAANSESLSNMVRLVMGPSGTVVTFPKGVALPSVFDSKPCSYPPPREKCAGPSCTNSYKYRDSRSNLPLCSLLCYRAVQGSAHSVSTC